MSSLSESSMACKGCGATQQLRVWDSLNVTLDPSLKEALLKGELHAFKCKHCGWSCHVSYPMLYHDMAKRLMIWIWSDPAPPKMPVLPYSGEYQLRLTATLNELIEKVRIFDGGLDDRAMELTKCALVIQSLRSGTPLTEKLLFSGVRRDAKGEFMAVFEHLKKAGSGCAVVPMESYEGMKRALSKAFGSADPDRRKWIRTDVNYITALLQRLPRT